MHMIRSDDKLKIIEISKKYGVSRVFLFGSSLYSDNEPADIDIAVEGLASSLFFKFYSELIFNLSKPVDVVDLSIKTKLNDIIYAEGLALYD